MHHYSTLDDEALFRLMQADDQSAFTEIYNRYWEKLLAVSFFHARVKQTAEDMVHDVMLSLWKRRKDIEITSVEAYLGTAVKFAVFKNIAREQRRHELISGQQETGFTDDTESKLDTKFLEAYLRGEVEKLPAKARIIFQYSRSEQLKVSEIAAKTALTPKAVEYHITRALRLLRESLKKIKFVFI